MPSHCSSTNRDKSGPLADQYCYWIGEAQFQSRDFNGAAETLVSLARNFPESPLRLRAVATAAAAYARLPDWRRHDALLENPDGVFQRAAQLDPANELVVDGWLSLENSKFQQRDFSGAAAVYERLTNQLQALNQVQQCEAGYLFYRAKMELGDFAAALAAATNLVQIASAPTNQEWLATGWASQGAALQQLERLSDAVACVAEQFDERAGKTAMGGNLENRGTGDCPGTIDQRGGESHQFSGAVSGGHCGRHRAADGGRTAFEEFRCAAGGDK